MATWQHQNASSKGKGKGGWHDFPGDIAAGVEKAFNAGDAVAHFSIAGKSYSISFADMKQRCDTDASRVRVVRRVEPASSSGLKRAAPASSGTEAEEVDTSSTTAESSDGSGKKMKGAIEPRMWQFKGANHWHNFDSEACATVDDAFKSGKETVEVDTKGQKIVVNFREMKQYSGDATRMRTIRRIGSTDKVTEALSAASASPPDGRPIGCEKVPMRWDHMEKDYEEVELMDVPQHNVECSAVVQSFEKTIKKKIVSVKRIQNVRLWRMYSDQRELVRGKSINAGNANEHFLWHGASNSSAGAGATDIIKKSGFESQFSNCHPAGIWLSTNAAYSASGYAEACGDGKHCMVFLVRTVLGYMSVDDGSGRRCQMHGKEFGDSHHCGASSVAHKRKDDQVGGGADNRYVVYNNHQLYPAYLVKFVMAS